MCPLLKSQYLLLHYKSTQSMFEQTTLERPHRTAGGHFTWHLPHGRILFWRTSAVFSKLPQCNLLFFQLSVVFTRILPIVFFKFIVPVSGNLGYYCPPCINVVQFLAHQFCSMISMTTTLPRSHCLMYCMSIVSSGICLYQYSNTALKNCLE